MPDTPAVLTPILSPEQIARLREFVYALTRTGGKSWKVTIPPAEDDADVLLIGLINSHEALRSVAMPMLQPALPGPSAEP